MPPSAPARPALFALLFPVLFLGCKNLATVNVTVRDERTEMEKQVLGTYEELSEDLALVASVRGVDETGRVRVPPPESSGKKRALLAMQSREFNRDDIESFKKEGAAGENNQGLLTFFETEKTRADSKYKSFVQSKIEEENLDRTVLMRRVIEITPGRTERDLPDIQKIMASRNRDSAKPGEKIQLENGEWTAKSEKAGNR
ncbi:MAG: DUF1318 domain-containing protein [Planctomycetes bacterium]|nr:DUF1318 domain-containing protein [Planctomycetota bacterium]